MSPRALFRLFAFAELLTWAGLITAMILRATGADPIVVSIAGGVHGFIFLSYVAVTIFVWINERWRAGVGLLGLASAVIPFATLPFELVIDKKGLLSRDWRLGARGEEPRGFLEHVQRWVLRHPWLSAIILLVAVTVAFTVLLVLGPPVPKS